MRTIGIAIAILGMLTAQGSAQQGSDMSAEQVVAECISPSGKKIPERVANCVESATALCQKAHPSNPDARAECFEQLWPKVRDAAARRIGGLHSIELSLFYALELENAANIADSECRLEALRVQGGPLFGPMPQSLSEVAPDPKCLLEHMVAAYWTIAVRR